MKGFLSTNDKVHCCGCESCKQVCAHDAITMVEDEEGFRYPKIDKSKCVNCGLCKLVCSYESEIKKHSEEKYVFGGYHKSIDVRDKSTSGGAFTAIVEAFCDDNYVIFGAKSEGLNVYHDYVESKNEIDAFRKSKYSQSNMQESYKQVKEFLQKGKKVLFSGTPCQISALEKFLMKTDRKNLLTVEVVCEGVPSPHYVKKLDDYFNKKYNSRIKSLDYRYKKTNKFFKTVYGHWDFQVMSIVLNNGKHLKKDRWFNPFWKLWLEHLMSRPSCYECLFATSDRCADITLGDLWGVHLYCPELYGDNLGCSLVIGNSDKGKSIIKNAEKFMFGHKLDFNTALKYQSPMRKTINTNEKREDFLKDLCDERMTYKKIVKKWYKKPSLKLLWSKYIWGNRQKICFWNLKNRKRGIKNGESN